MVQCSFWGCPFLELRFENVCVCVDLSVYVCTCVSLPVCTSACVFLMCVCLCVIDEEILLVEKCSKSSSSISSTLYSCVCEGGRDYVVGTRLVGLPFQSDVKKAVSFSISQDLVKVNFVKLSTPLLLARLD